MDVGLGRLKMERGSELDDAITGDDKINFVYSFAHGLFFKIFTAIET